MGGWVGGGGGMGGGRGVSGLLGLAGFPKLLMVVLVWCFCCVFVACACLLSGFGLLRLGGHGFAETSIRSRPQRT